MEENSELIESLLKKAGEYGKTSFDLVKLKALDKTTEAFSTIMTSTVVFILYGFFVLLFNLGLAFWLGDVLGRVVYGFLLVALFYGILGLFFHIFLQKWLKRHFGNYFIRQFFK